jgi:hypothetical protein
MKRIHSDEYFGAVQEYFADHKMPSRVYAFLLAILKADNYILSDDLLDLRVDTLEATDDCMRFCSDTECVLVLCCEVEK